MLVLAAMVYLVILSGGSPLQFRSLISQQLE
jgi:hypothetical protein